MKLLRPAFAAPHVLPRLRPALTTPLCPSACRLSRKPLISQQQPPSSNSRVPNKWLVAASAAIVHALHDACVYMTPTTLLTPMRLTLNLTVAEITRPLIVFRLVNALLLIPGGFLLDKLGPQRSLRYSVVASAVLFPFLAFVQNCPHLLILQALFAVLKLYCGLSAMTLLIFAHFRDGRGVGTATGILLSGYSLIGFVAPAAMGFVSDCFGWRTAVAAVTAFFGVIAVPLTFRYLKEPAQDTAKRQFTRRKGRISGGKDSFGFDLNLAFVNLAIAWVRRAFSFIIAGRTVVDAPMLGRVVNEVGVNGIKLHDESGSILRRSVASNSFGLDSRRRRTGTRRTSTCLSDEESENTKRKSRERLFSGAFLTISVAVSFFSFAMHVMVDHFIVFLNEDFGMPFRLATMCISSVNLMALVTKLGVGPLADRYNKALLIAVFGAVAALGCFCLLDFSLLGFAVTASVLKVFVFIVMYSIGYAALYGLTTAVLPEFGREKLCLRANINLMLLFASGSLGSYVASWARATGGCYRWPFLWSAVSFLIVCAAGLVKYFLYDRREARLPSFVER